MVRLDLGFGPRSLVMFLRFCQKEWEWEGGGSESQPLQSPSNPPTPQALLLLTLEMYSLYAARSWGDRLWGERTGNQIKPILQLIPTAS